MGQTYRGHHRADCVQSRVRQILGGSPTGLAESSSLSLRTGHSSQVALHLVSRQRSYHFRLQAGNGSLDGTFTRQFKRLHRRTRVRCADHAGYGPHSEPYLFATLPSNLRSVPVARIASESTRPSLITVEYERSPLYNCDSVRKLISNSTSPSGAPIERAIATAASP